MGALMTWNMLPLSLSQSHPFALVTPNEHFTRCSGPPIARFDHRTKMKIQGRTSHS
jgi:hypothetical protein